jgi:hypothetical protein
MARVEKLWSSPCFFAFFFSVLLTFYGAMHLVDLLQEILPEMCNDEIRLCKCVIVNY